MNRAKGQSRHRRAGAVATIALAVGGARYASRRIRGFVENTRLTHLDAFPILTYHRVVATTTADRLWGDLLAADFAWQISLLARRGYRGVSLYEAWQARDPVTSLPPADMVVVSFDDAYAETLHTAIPVLERVGFTATLFVPTSYVGGKGYFARFSSSRPEWPDILGWDDLRALRARGFELGSHTRSHPFLDELADRDDVLLQEEIRGSRADLEVGLGCAVPFLAYPHGSFSERVLTVAREAGYLGAVSTLAPDGTMPLFALRRRDWFAKDLGSPGQRARLRVRFALSYPGPHSPSAGRPAAQGQMP